MVGNQAAICSKVRLGDVFSVKIDDNSKFVAYNNKINRKHVDFLLCDWATMRPLVSIELDDRSHDREDRRERDAFVDQVFAAARLPLLHVPVKRAYVIAEITEQLTPYFSVVPAASTPSATPIKAAQTPTSASDTKTSPLCPKCGNKMVLRSSKSGANAGNRFWGCSTYPNCWSMVAIAE